MRTDKNRHRNVPPDARRDEIKAGNRNARRSARAALRNLYR